MRFAWIAVVLLTTLARADLYILPDGGGDRSGRDFANARAAGDFQDVVRSLAPGQTLFVGSGTYAKSELVIDVSGTAAAPITITGLDTGKGLPLFSSDFDPKNASKTGNTLLDVSAGVSHVVVKDVRVDGHNIAVRLRGRNQGVRIENLDVIHTRDGFWIDGGATADKPDAGSRDLTLKDCRVRFFTKRGVRILGGVRDVKVLNCHVDAGGKEYAFENFPIGFHVIGGKDGVIDRDITFTDCTAASAYQKTDKTYVNGDGFCAEGDASNITYLRCGSFNNTDGGWDVKASNVKWIDCVSIGNKRNFRIWPSGSLVTLDNCLSAFAHDPTGNNRHVNGVWLKDGVDVTFTGSTFYEDPGAINLEAGSNPKPSKVLLKNCLFRAAKSSDPIKSPASTEIKTEQSVIADAPELIKLESPSPTWRGGDTSFDSVSHPGVGYRFPARPATESGSR